MMTDRRRHGNAYPPWIMYIYSSADNVREFLDVEFYSPFLFIKLPKRFICYHLSIKLPLYKFFTLLLQHRFISSFEWGVKKSLFFSPFSSSFSESEKWRLRLFVFLLHVSRTTCTLLEDKFVLATATIILMMTTRRRKWRRRRWNSLGDWYGTCLQEIFAAYSYIYVLMVIDDDDIYTVIATSGCLHVFPLVLNVESVQLLHSTIHLLHTIRIPFA